MDEHENGSGKPVGGDPNAEASAEECEAKAADCEFRAGEDIDRAHESFFQPDDELHETFKAEPIPLRIDEEGLIAPIDETLQVAPPFSPETVVCLEDKSSYVELWADEVVSRGWENGVRSWKLPSGDTVPAETIVLRRRYDDDGTERQRESFEPQAVEQRFGESFVCTHAGWVPVRPIRERCRHYKRVVMGNDDQPDAKSPGHRIIFRLCSIRRSNGGAFMSLRDEAVYGCDFRDPIDPASTKQYLDDPDEKTIREKLHRVLVRAWGQPGEDLDLRNEAGGVGGIFSS